MDLIQALILAVVEGITEYLPISSTGHIILASAFMGIEQNPFVKDFTVIVQFGAILSVIVLYWRKLIVSLEIYKKLFIAFLPAGVLGVLLKSKIDLILGDVSVVAWALIIGGILIIWIEKKQMWKAEKDEISYTMALKIGLIQCLAFIPGVSRAAATILGAKSQGLSTKSAAEFSFLLALPTLTGATVIKLYKLLPEITHDQVHLLLFGNIVSFIVALIAVKGFVGYLSRHGLAAFGYYRIILGFLVLLML